MAGKLKVLHHELIDSLDANELQDFIYSEIFALEMKLSSSIAQLIVGGQKSGRISGHYLNITSFQSTKTSGSILTTT